MILERIVRPFAVRDTSPPRRVESSDQGEPENLRLEIGRNASAGGQALITTWSASVRRYMTAREREV